jgi:hypothetical protein
VRIEKVFMAAESNTQLGRLVGPFNSAPEAEIRAAELGWGWVVVYSNAVNDAGKVVDVQKRYYQPTQPAQPAYAAPSRTPEELAALRHNLRTPDPRPLNHEEILFFASYEVQMLPEPTPRIDPTRFKADIKRRING